MSLKVRYGHKLRLLTVLQEVPDVDATLQGGGKVSVCITSLYMALKNILSLCQRRGWSRH